MAMQGRPESEWPAQSLPEYKLHIKNNATLDISRNATMADDGSTAADGGGPLMVVHAGCASTGEGKHALKTDSPYEGS
jgi:hypothetical protein